VHLVETKVNCGHWFKWRVQCSAVSQQEGLCDLVGMVDYTELLTVWRPDLGKTAHSSEGFVFFLFIFICNDVTVITKQLLCSS